MNIAHLLPASARFPLTKHNGRYEWAFRLANLQANAGHTVTIYCGDSPSSDNATLQWGSIPRGEGSHRERNLALLRQALQDPQHDIFHSHLDYLHYEVAAETTRPIVFTQHWFPNPEIANAAHRSNASNVLAVPVTTHMRQADQALGIPAAQVIHHGIDLQLFSVPSQPRGDRLLYVGRISPQKGVRELVDLVLATDEQLDIVGKVNPVDLAYWDAVLPHVDGERIRYLGPLPQTDVAERLGAAKAFVFAPQSPEAFGQTVIEAQACGTPAIVNDCGANSELVSQGVSGYVFADPADFRAAIQNAPGLSQANCRAFAEQFDIHTMARNYEQLYQRLTNQP